MALTNIFREPRREITESAIGIAVLAGFLLIDYAFALWLEAAAGLSDSGRRELPWPIGMLAGLLVALILGIVLLITHELGDAICNAFQRRGLHLRPRVRY